MSVSEPQPAGRRRRQGVVVWITGLPSAGKSTFAQRARERFHEEGVTSCVLDGDAVRKVLVPPPGYTAEARDQFYETLARLAALLAGQDLVVLVPATAHRTSYRDRARALAPAYLEVWVQADLEAVRERDDKGLYAAAASGEVHGLPGVDAAYEPPVAPDVVAQGGEDDGAVDRLVSLARQRYR